MRDSGCIGTVYVVAHRSEMGTGVRTSLPRIVADELEADWNRVKVVQAEGDPRYGSQDTDGSHSVREFFDTMREAGAEEFISLVERHYGPVVEYFLSYRVNSQ